MRSRSCARTACQFAALTSDSNPAASSAHIVVNMASLPSTDTLVIGLGRNRGPGGGAGWAAGACALAHEGNKPTMQPSTIRIFLTAIFMWFVAIPKSSAGERSADLDFLAKPLHMPTYKASQRRVKESSCLSSAAKPTVRDRKASVYCGMLLPIHIDI